MRLHCSEGNKHKDIIPWWYVLCRTRHNYITRPEGKINSSLTKSHYPFLTPIRLFVSFLLCPKNGLFQGSHFIYNHSFYSQWPGIGLQGVVGLVKGRGDGKFCASPLLYLLESFQRRLCCCDVRSEVYFVSDLTQSGIKTLLIYPHTWPPEHLSLWS